MAGLMKKFQQTALGEKIEEAEEGESLTTVLGTPESRAGLTNLLVECTEAMRQALLDVLEAADTENKPDAVANVDDNVDVANSGAESTTQDIKRSQEIDQKEKAANAANMKELKEAALKYFDEWNSLAIGRIGEAINADSRKEAQQRSASSQSSQNEPPPGAAPQRRFQEPPPYASEVDQKLVELYPPIKNSLTSLPTEKRALILHSILLLLLSLEHYHAHSRVLLLRLTTSLDLSIKFLASDESKVARGLLAAAENLQADEETKKKAEENKSARRWKIGVAGVAGAALIGITGGLAAPLLAAGVGTVMGGLGLGATAAAGYLGSLAGSAVLVGGLFGAYGGRMTSKMMDQYAREVEDFAFVPVKAASRPRKIEKEFRRLRVGIGISGWVTDKDGVVEPWKVIGFELESFALRWELEALMNLGNGLQTLVKSAAWGFAKREIIKQTVFAALMAGLWPLALLKVSRIIENPWSVASYRAQKAGEVLADALINRAQGERPVTLIGYSLGAKVIYTCLQRLAERKAFGLVENAILIGSPSPAAASDWRKLRAIVAGRVVNVYSTQDYLLGYLYRTAGLQYGVAGLQAIQSVQGVENVDVTDTITSHTQYQLAVGNILQKVGFENVDIDQLAKDQAALKEEQEKEKQSSEEANSKEGTNNVEISDEYVEGLEKEVEKKNEQSYVGWAQERMMSAGNSASDAYQKAKSQWFARKQGGNSGPEGEAATTEKGTPSPSTKRSSKRGSQVYEGT